MKKLILIAVTGAILISCVLISAVLGGSAVESSPGRQLEASESEDKTVFTLSAQNGRLVVYKEGEDEPFLVTDTYVSSLPKSDRINLENGVEVKGERELKRAIEDYCS